MPDVGIFQFFPFFFFFKGGNGTVKIGIKFRTRLAQGASKIGLDKLWSKSMHLPWNRYYGGPVKIVHGGNGGNNVDADSGGQSDGDGEDNDDGEDKDDGKDDEYTTIN